MLQQLRVGCLLFAGLLRQWRFTARRRVLFSSDPSCKSVCRRRRHGRRDVLPGGALMRINLSASLLSLQLHRCIPSVAIFSFQIITGARTRSIALLFVRSLTPTLPDNFSIVLMCHWPASLVAATFERGIQHVCLSQGSKSEYKLNYR